MSEFEGYSTCRGCEAYVHHLLKHCPLCGSEQLPSAEWLEPPESESLDGLPDSLDALGAWLMERADAESVGSALRTVQDASSDRPEDMPRVIRAYCAQLEADGASPAWEGLIADRHVRGFEPSSQAMLSRLKYRYLGGLPGHPNEADVVVTGRSGSVVLTDASTTREMIQLPASRVLSASAFIEDVPVLKSTVGFAFENVVSFPHATTKGGGLLVLFATGAGTSSFAIGNRSGLFATGGKPEFYFGMVEVISAWLHFAARAQEAQRGTAGYARELGLRMEESHTSEPALARRLQELGELFSSGLITEGEYDAKRREILAEL